MTRSRDTLYGNVPEKSAAVLLLVDVINDLSFAGSQPLVNQASALGKRLATFKRRCKRLGCAAIYVNDNFGRWRSDFQHQVQHCLEEDQPGRKLVELIQPEQDDYFVLKPAHSGFYSTTLEVLLRHLQARTLIITGLATNICVLFTANDAYMRGYRVLIPSDCVAANSTQLSRQALRAMQSTLKAEVAGSRAPQWARWIRAAQRGK